MRTKTLVRRATSGTQATKLEYDRRISFSGQTALRIASESQRICLKIVDLFGCGTFICVSVAYGHVVAMFLGARKDSISRGPSV